MRIWHISDTHGQHEGLEIPSNVDIVIHSGDSTNYRRWEENLPEWNNFLEWFSALPIKNKIYVPGNHDSYCFYNERSVKSECISNGIHFLNKSSVEVDGRLFYGDPITPEFGSWYYTTKREKMHKHWDLIPEEVDVLITHGPPKGILDLTQTRLGEYELCGDKSLLKKTIELPKLKAHLFGHIHNYKDVINTGLRKVNHITYSNAAAVVDGKIGMGVHFHGNIIEI